MIDKMTIEWAGARLANEICAERVNVKAIREYADITSLEKFEIEMAIEELLFEADPNVEYDDIDASVYERVYYTAARYLRRFGHVA